MERYLEDGAIQTSASAYVRPNQTHLATCGMTDDPMCALCSRLIKPEARKTACLEALKDGRRTWRHDGVLGGIAWHHRDPKEKERREDSQYCKRRGKWM